jgi:alpha-1,6-mannosyltransferase
MKIIDVAEFYAERGGGVRTYIEHKLQAASALGHDMLIIAPGPEDRDEQRRFGRIAWVRSRPMPFDPRYYLLTRERAVHALLDRERPDVVEGSSPWTGGTFVARYREHFADNARPRKSFVFHQDPIAVYPQTLLGSLLGEAHVDSLFAPYWAHLRRLSRRFDVTVVSGQWLADRLAGFGIYHPLAVPFGIDKKLFVDARPDPSLRAELIARAGAAPNAQLLVTVSRHHPEKRLGTLLNAVQLVAAQRPIALVMYGDGPLTGWLTRKARGLPVWLAGVTRDRALLARVLASAGALLHGSAAETYGLVVAEALNAGLPIVVPNRGGAADLARPAHAETYPAGDAQACALAITRMLDRDREQLRNAARQAGANLVSSQQAHFEGLFALYQTLVDDTVRKPRA